MIPTDSVYQMTQILQDSQQALYNNLLTINSDISDVPGVYGCAVINTFGTSNSESLVVSGKNTVQVTLGITSQAKPLWRN